MALVGHPYLLDDAFASYDIVGKLGRLGVRPITAEVLEDEALAQAVAALMGQPYWTFEKEITGAAGAFLAHP
ncbi:MAG TPA: 2-hydroxyglutaryl-CoA dehydratase, partial [Dehalococcoidia bacterium]|nr:2-hydroxyglutaryl-CoA dehydratase [Dehalococcoidia bacterium]